MEEVFFLDRFILVRLFLLQKRLMEYLKKYND